MTLKIGVTKCKAVSISKAWSKFHQLQIRGSNGLTYFASNLNAFCSSVYCITLLECSPVQIYQDAVGTNWPSRDPWWHYTHIRAVVLDGITHISKLWSIQAKSSSLHRSKLQIQFYVSLLPRPQKLVTSLILSHLDNCNYLLAGIPKKLVNKVQSVMNCAAHLVCKAPKCKHCTSWLYNAE